jgi:hypothetical protein
MDPYFRIYFNAILCVHEDLRKNDLVALVIIHLWPSTLESKNKFRTILPNRK